LDDNKRSSFYTRIETKEVHIWQYFTLAFYSCIGRGVDQQVQYLKSVKLKLTEMIIKTKTVQRLKPSVAIFELKRTI
jgi:hypothetical protein